MSETGQVRSVYAGFPPKLIGPLLQSDARYIVLYGGRGSSKSWSVARALLIRATNKRLRILCCRQYMANMAESVHKLLVDQIHLLNLEDRFVIEKSRIYGVNGSEFNFVGIQNNPAGLKSYESIDICWVEEAAGCTSTSWSILIPTIRKENSQIIVTFNPELASDDTWQRFVVSPPPNSEVIKINFDENPYFPDVLRQEAEYMREKDPDSYLNIWLGHPRVFLDNAVYGRELRAATEEGRICSVPYDPLAQVHCFWDLGWRDQTSIVMAQLIHFKYHIIDYLEGTQTTIIEYLKRLQTRPYIYGTHYLPHDAVAKDKGSGKSVEDILRQHGNRVQIVPRLSVNDGINAARVVWERCWIDENKCADLLQHLRKYCYEMKRLPSGELVPSGKPEPAHTEDSHAADAFRYMAVALKGPKKPFKEHTPYIMPTGNGWMA